MHFMLNFTRATYDIFVSPNKAKRNSRAQVFWSAKSDVGTKLADICTKSKLADICTKWAYPVLTRTKWAYPRTKLH